MPREKRVKIQARVAWLFYAIVNRLNFETMEDHNAAYSAGEWIDDAVREALKAVGTGYDWYEELDAAADREGNADLNFATRDEMEAVFGAKPKDEDGSNPPNTFSVKPETKDALENSLIPDMSRYYYPDGDGAIRMGKALYLVMKYFAKEGKSKYFTPLQDRVGEVEVNVLASE